MSTQIPEQYVKSGAITHEVRGWVRKILRPGMAYLEACEMVEREILARGGSLPFPCGIGVNQVTAHYAPQEDDRGTFGEKDVIKVDFGVHIDGYLTDTAVTVTFNPEYQPMLDATERALASAIEIAKKDVRTGEIGRAINHEAARFGFRVIENLTGHTVDRYTVHAGKGIPNLFMPNQQVLRKGDVFAIEPFLTLKSAAGFVVDAPTETIFSIVARKNTGSKELDGFVNEVWNERKTLPFTPRWYVEVHAREKLDLFLKELVKKRIVRSYPTLVEASGNPVAQFEHTAALGDGGLVVLT